MTMQVGNEQYRFDLRRLVNATGYGEVLWFMLNPSSADAVKNDPTIRRCIDFSRRWGFKTLRVVNLLPIRTKNPREAMSWYRGCPPFPGEFFQNHGILDAACSEANAVILAWGSNGYAVGGDTAREDACSVSDEVWTLGWTANGQPRHPLYVPAETLPIHASDCSRRWLRRELVPV